MKAKGTAFIAILLTAALLLTGCKPLVEDAPQSTTVYATFYPIYALTELITDGAEDVELHCLVQPQDGCLRSYELSDWDMYLLAYSADVLLAAGNGLEGFTETLEEIGETSLPLAEVMYGLEMYQMSGVDDEESHFTGSNPHLYMSIEGAEAILESIAGTMSLLDSKNASVYEENLTSAHDKLHQMQDFIEEQTEIYTDISAAVLNETMFYTAQDCGLEIVFWYSRENSEMLYGDSLQNCLAELDESGAQVVLIEKQAPAALVETLEAAGYEVAKLDTMSTLEESDGAEGYLTALEENLQAVADACRKVKEKSQEENA